MLRVCRFFSKQDCKNYRNQLCEMRKEQKMRKFSVGTFCVVTLCLYCVVLSYSLLQNFNDNSKRKNNQHILYTRSDYVSELSSCNLPKLTEQQKLDCFWAAKERVQQVNTNLSTLLNTGSERDRCYAAAMLGLYRSEYAVGVLNDNITLENSGLPNKDNAISSNSLSHKSNEVLGRYPCLQSLILIGDIAALSLISNLKHSDESKVRELSLSGLRSIDGLSLAQSRLKKAIKEETDTEEKLRLNSALANIVNAQFFIVRDNVNLVPEIPTPAQNR